MNKNTCLNLSRLFLLLCILIVSSCGDENVEPMETFDLVAPNSISIPQVSATAFRVEWNAVPGASAYETIVARDEAFEEVLSQYDNVRDFGTGFNVIDLDPNTAYYVKVRTIIDNEASPYTESKKVTTNEGVGTEPGTPLKDEAKTFRVGMAVRAGRLNGQYDAILKREYSSITAEFEMKMNIMYPSQGNYDFSKADAIVDYAVANGIEVHGHALIWHSATPNWVENFSGTDEEFSAMVEDYIKTTVGRYKGKIKSWDVVNEAFNDQNGSLRNSVFFQKMGPDYIAQCYQWTREADPDVLIFYNDYNMVWDDTKRGAALDMIDDFLEREIPVDGFGFQMHISYDGPSGAKIASSSKEVTDRGLLLHFSELDIRANPNNNISSLTLDRAQAQQEKYKEVVSIYNAIPDENKFALTVWGLKDNESWLLDFWGHQDWPLMYNEDFSFKKAHTGFLEGLE